VGLTLGPDLALAQGLLARPVGIIFVLLILLVLILVFLRFSVAAVRILVEHGVDVLVVRHRQGHLRGDTRRMFMTRLKV